MNKKRLLKLAEYLKTVPRKKFRYAAWFESNKNRFSFNDCRAVGCAFGHACAISSFRRAGLKMHLVDCGDGKVIGDPYFMGSYGTGAAELFFDLSADEADYLFLPCESGLTSFATPKQVAHHIERFVKRGGKP